MQHMFVFVDLAGFTALTEAHGDETGADFVNRFVAIVRAALQSDGQLVGVNGDAVFVVAPDPTAALRVVTRIFDLAAHGNHRFAHWRNHLWKCLHAVTGIHRLGRSNFLHVDGGSRNCDEVQGTAA